METQNQSTPQTETSSHIKSPTPGKNSRKSKKIIITLSLIIIIGFMAVLFLKQNNNPDKSKTLSKNLLNNPALYKLAEKLPIPKITLVPISLIPTIQTDNGQTTQDPTASQTADSNHYLPQDWKTYKNSEINFSLNYPSNLSVHENSHGLGIVDISFISPDNTDSANSPDYQILIYPKTVGKLIGQDFDQLYTLPAPSTQRMTMGGQENTPQQFTKFENLTIDGLRAFKFMTTSDPPDPNVEAELGDYIEINDSTFIISTNESNRDILNHMLSTFKLLP